MTARYVAALTTIVRSSAIPYGYTLTIWATGSVVEHRHGSPGVGDVLLFVLGAVAGFMVVALGVRSRRSEPLNDAPRDFTRTGVIQIVAVGVAVGAAALTSEISSGVVWPLGAFLATLLYLLLAALELVLVRKTDPDAS